MPKVNVYLPDDLAAAVKETGISVSPVCQKALEEAVRNVRNLRRAITVIKDPTHRTRATRAVESRTWEYMTQRLKDANRLVKEAVEPFKLIETKDLLVGLLDEGENMAVRVLESLGVDVEELRAAAKRVVAHEETTSAATTDDETERGVDNDNDNDNDESDADNGNAIWRRLSQPARTAMASAVEASVDLGHNYLGCEHLLFGLVSDAESGAGKVLDSFGVELGNLRRAVGGAVAGYNQRRDNEKNDEPKELHEILRRLEALEQRLSSS